MVDEKKPAADSGAKKGATKKTEPIVLKAIQVVRVRCACDSHDPPPAPQKPTEAKPPAGHEKQVGKAAPPRKPAADPWVRGLFVVWAPKPEEGAQADFALAQTDYDGHLCMPGDSSDSFKIATHEGQEFLFWFVRHSDPGVARKVRDAVSAGDRKTYGPGFSAKLTKDAKPDPGSVVLSFTATGKGANGKDVSEPVLSIPPKSSFFVPKGSKLYDEWMLFHVPVAAAKTKKTVDVQPFEGCPDVRDQVKRLQFHLGTLRYLVGDHGHPYRPTVTGSFPNVGVFDLVTWNSVIHFQADAAAGNAAFVPAKPHGKLLSPLAEKKPSELDKSWGESKSPSDDDEKKASHEYVTVTPAPDAPRLGDHTKGLVCETTAGVLALWLAKSLRKSGGIMVTVEGNPNMQKFHWLRDDAAVKLVALSERVKALGFSGGVKINHTYRDARVDALGAGFGRAKRSIHKTGFAVDLWMSGFQPDGGWPIEFTMVEKDYAESKGVQDAAAGSAGADGTKVARRVKVGWELFAEASPASSNPGDAEHYVDTITPWKYDETSPMGGNKLPPKDGKFIKLTQLAQMYGFVPIHSFGDDNLGRQDWRGGPRLLPCSSVVELASALEELSQVRGNGKLGSAVLWRCETTGVGDTFVGKPTAEREAELASISAVKVEVSKFDPKELAAITQWIGHHGAKNLPKDLSIDVTYQIKAVKEPDKAKQLLEDQLKAKFAPILKGPKGKKGEPPPKSPLDGWKFECTPVGAEKGVEVTLSSDGITVGDGGFPNQSFKMRPLRPTLEPNLGYPVQVYFPQTVGESIGMEWWHFQFSKGLAMTDKDLADAKARAATRQKDLDQTIAKAKADGEAADVVIHDKNATAHDKEAAKKTKKDAAQTQKKAEEEKKGTLKVQSATTLGGTWWSMIQSIGWTEEGMRAMGYVDDDFTAKAC